MELFYKLLFVGCNVVFFLIVKFALDGKFDPKNEWTEPQGKYAGFKRKKM
jgi:hypothetical protein